MVYSEHQELDTETLALRWKISGWYQFLPLQMEKYQEMLWHVDHLTYEVKNPAWQTKMTCQKDCEGSVYMN